MTTTLPVKEAWDRILDWFKHNTPADRNKLDRIPGPASPDEIAGCETQLGIALPDALRESYSLFNGHGRCRIFDYGNFLSTEEVVRNAMLWRRGVEEGDFDSSEIKCSRAIRRKQWDKGWIPFTDSGSGDHFCIDMNPTKSGVMGQVFRFGRSYGPTKILANSFEEFLTLFLNDLEAGKYRWSDADTQIMPIESFNDK